MSKMYRRRYEESSDEYDTQGCDTLEERGYIERLKRELFEERKKYSEAQREIKALSSKYARKESDFESERERIMQESASQISTLEILLAAERGMKLKGSPSATTKKSLNLLRENHSDVAKWSQEKEHKRHLTDRITRDVEKLENYNRTLQEKNATLQSEVNRLAVQTDKDGISIRSLKDEVNTVLTLLQRSKGLNYKYEETIRTITDKNHELELENKRLKEHHENYETALRSLQQDRYHYLVSKQCGFDPLIHSTRDGRNKNMGDQSSVVEKENQECLSQEASAKDDGKTLSKKIESLEKAIEQLRHENESLKSKLEEASKKIHSDDESTDSTSSEDTGSEDSKKANSRNTDHTTGDLTDAGSRAPETEGSVHSPRPHDEDRGKLSSVGASNQQGKNSQGSETNNEQENKT
ncbi:hypothetical protein CHS0354_026339 [Potamilus streckersoni]|uniref:Uncharacterized protein n=1 Tax=Potamilus streckersoni TaxID=2493646 RepID=A0AAE0W6E4_9BIVA|nr:hypothetical protein CHS0354_026339 [Potamilus streckersoni]